MCRSTALPPWQPLTPLVVSPGVQQRQQQRVGCAPPRAGASPWSHSPTGRPQTRVSGWRRPTASCGACHENSGVARGCVMQRACPLAFLPACLPACGYRCCANNRWPRTYLRMVAQIVNMPDQFALMMSEAHNSSMRVPNHQVDSSSETNAVHQAISSTLLFASTVRAVRRRLRDNPCGPEWCLPPVARCEQHGFCVCVCARACVRASVHPCIWSSGWCRCDCRASSADETSGRTVRRPR